MLCRNAIKIVFQQSALLCITDSNNALCGRAGGASFGSYQNSQLYLCLKGLCCFEDPQNPQTLMRTEIHLSLQRHRKRLVFFYASTRKLFCKSNFPPKKKLLSGHFCILVFSFYSFFVLVFLQHKRQNTIWHCHFEKHKFQKWSFFGGHCFCPLHIPKLSGMFRRSASLALPHLKSFAAIPSVSLVQLGHTNRSVFLSHESQREIALV